MEQVNVGWLNNEEHGQSQQGVVIDGCFKCIQSWQ